jgi:alanyl-tRNA synthetase
LDTRKTGKAIIHIGSVKAAGLKKGDSVLAKVDTQRRLSIGRNHTATHLLQAALRKVLGTHVQQQGSLVAPDRLRFDFTHFKDISSDELDRIEEVVNGFILGNYALTVKQMPLSEAKKKGYLAFFGEKYESRVRVVGIGDISGELCGGTHLGSTGQIGLFKIIHEGSIASGIRRIEAVTGNFAYKAAKEERNLLNEVAQILKVPQDKLVPELEKRIAQAKALEKQLTSQRIDSTKQALDSFIQEAETIKEVKVIAREMQNSAMDLLRKAVDLIKEKASNSVIALASSSGEKAFLVVGVTADLVEKGFDASKLILDMANIIGGSGGGRKDFAQAGGTRPENFAQAFKALKEAVANSQP